MNDRMLALQAWESLFRAQHEIFEECSSDFDGADLTQPEYDVLLTVLRCPSRTARLRDITSRALISQPSVSRLIDRMVSRNLVEKCLDPDDGRGSLVRATEEGSRRFRTLAAKHSRHVAERMSTLDPDELRQLMTLTQRLRKEVP